LLDFYDKCQISSTNLFDVILTDNGSEFQGLPLIESEEETGLLRFKAFYCDPYRSNQKGACERNHALIRRLYEKGRSMDGLLPEDVIRIFSLANSYPRKSLGFHSPIELFKRKHGNELLGLLGYQEIPLTHINFKRIRE
jgi:transposase, IS30 family